MVRVPTEISSAERARWLAELSKGLEEAQKLMWQLGVSADDSPEAMDLYVRIEAARLEVEALRLSRRAPTVDNIGPEWSGLLPWQRGQARGA